MNPQRHPVELIDIEGEADSIAEDFGEALQRSDLHTMRDCFTRLTRNHRSVVHVLTELCDDVRQLKGK